MHSVHGAFPAPAHNKMYWNIHGCLQRALHIQGFDKHNTSFSWTGLQKHWKISCHHSEPVSCKTSIKFFTAILSLYWSCPCACNSGCPVCSPCVSQDWIYRSITTPQLPPQIDSNPVGNTANSNCVFSQGVLCTEAKTSGTHRKNIQLYNQNTIS